VVVAEHRARTATGPVADESGKIEIAEASHCRSD